jgi:hypothetical protein
MRRCMLWRSRENPRQPRIESGNPFVGRPDDYCCGRRRWKKCSRRPRWISDPARTHGTDGAKESTGLAPAACEVKPTLCLNADVMQAPMANVPRGTISEKPVLSTTTTEMETSGSLWGRAGRPHYLLLSTALQLSPSFRAWADICTSLHRSCARARRH